MVKSQNIGHSKKRGAAMVEFALIATFFFVPLTLGTAVFGLNLVRGIQVSQLNRDADNMSSRGIDFSISENRRMLLHLASGLNISDAAGDGVIILSTIECRSAGQAVCIRRIVIGNAGLRLSSFANPTLIDAAGNVNFASDTGARADSFLDVMPMDIGDIGYVAETYFRSPDLDIPGFRTGTGVYARAVF